MYYFLLLIPHSSLLLFHSLLQTSHCTNFPFHVCRNSPQACHDRISMESLLRLPSLSERLGPRGIRHELAKIYLEFLKCNNVTNAKFFKITNDKVLVFRHCCERPALMKTFLKMDNIYSSSFSFRDACRVSRIEQVRQINSVWMQYRFTNIFAHFPVFIE